MLHLCLQLGVPCSWGLLQSVQCLLEVTYNVGPTFLVAGWLCHVEILLQLAIEECCLCLADDALILGCHDGWQRPQSGVLAHWCVALLEVDALKPCNLKPLETRQALSLNVAVEVQLDLVDPLDMNGSYVEELLQESTYHWRAEMSFPCPWFFSTSLHPLRSLLSCMLTAPSALVLPMQPCTTQLVASARAKGISLLLMLLAVPLAVLLLVLQVLAVLLLLLLLLVLVLLELAVLLLLPRLQCSPAYVFHCLLGCFLLCCPGARAGLPVGGCTCCSLSCLSHTLVHGNRHQV